MVTDLQKHVLASLYKLQGGTAGEIAADLGVEIAKVTEYLHELAASGYVKPLGNARSIEPNGVQHIPDNVLRENPLVVTGKGQKELIW